MMNGVCSVVVVLVCCVMNGVCSVVVALVCCTALCVYRLIQC